MKSLLWKEWRENLKWAGLPALVILLPLLLLGGPDEPMAGVTGAVLFFVTPATFGAVLGFLQVFFESRGDQRALLLHRPLSRSRIFLGKAVAGVVMYLLALGIPFVGVEAWMATPGHMAAPYQWGAGLPWLADILTGVVYYFAGMLTAQREARWYGSRGLGLAAAFFCTFLVWSVPEFWQALLAVVTFAVVVGVAAWGSFIAGGAYAPQPPLARAALAVTFLAGLLVVSVGGKLAVAELTDSSTGYGHGLDRDGRVLIVPWKSGVGPVEPVTDLEGRVPPYLQGKAVDRNVMEEIEAPMASMDWPTFRSYRNPGRFYVEYRNDTRPGREVWYYSAGQGRLLGYDADFNQLLGSFGPDGFTPAGRPPGARFEGELRYPTRGWGAFSPDYLAFPGGVYTVDFSRRTIRTLFTPPRGESVVWARHWKDRREKRSLAVVSTDRSVQVLTEAGEPVVSVPRAYDRSRYRLASVTRLEGPERYVFWYKPSLFLEPEEASTTPGQVLEYSAAGDELARRTVPPLPEVRPSRAEALYGLVTPAHEVVVLAGPIYYLRSQARLSQGVDTWVALSGLEQLAGYFLPGLSAENVGRGSLVPGFAALSFLSSVACALACFLLARRYAFSGVRCLGWALCGLLFGWVGLVLMLALQEWPARVRCPSCGRGRLVDRERCEHCGAPHAPPARDGTEIFEESAAAPPAALAGR
jgi:hypothetical protein